MRALAFGEILWDISSSGRTLGGAPLNVAGHIVRLGGQAMIVSALGNDSLGHDAAAALDGLGVDSSLVHRSSCATGYAEILLEDGIPSYRFNDPAAWDDIWLSEEELDRLSSLSFDAVIYGTLACRHERSRTTLFRLLDRIRGRDFFFDVNIRLSFYTDDLIRAGLERATILKMNDEELPLVVRAAGCDAAAGLFDIYPKLSKIILTQGSKGSACYERGRVSRSGCGRGRVVSTVGAGDSLSAAFLFFNSLGLESAVCLEKASMVADYVVARQAAIPEYDSVLMRSLGL